MKVLFVCTGNICRSPVAQRLLEQCSVQNGLDLVVESAGTRALNGQPMHPESMRVLLERGIDPGSFSSRMLTPAIIAGFDLVLGMTREHRATARQLAPVRWKRMFALRELPTTQAGLTVSRAAVDPTDPRLDIDDPIGCSAEVFDRVSADIGRAIKHLLPWIEHQVVLNNNREIAK